MGRIGVELKPLPLSVVGQDMAYEIAHHYHLPLPRLWIAFCCATARAAAAQHIASAGLTTSLEVVWLILRDARPFALQPTL